jgi:RHS repeat-associated protein
LGAAALESPDPRDESFAWDKASNAVPVDRALRVIAGAVEQNRVVQWGATRYDYDAQGRMVRKSTPAGPVVFAWNDEHQLVASGSARGEWRYHYDALGRRIAKQRHDGARNGTRADAATWFVWDGMRLAQELVGEHCVTTIYEDAGSYVPLARVEQGLGQKTVRPEQIFHFHTDVNGAPEELTSHAGKLIWRARYRTWGNLATEAWDRDEEWAEDVGRRSQNLRFQGQYFDAETGLHYNTFRYYDPEIGRFASQDPIGLSGGLNLYQYAPDPLNWIDPWGWAPCFFDGEHLPRLDPGSGQGALGGA